MSESIANNVKTNKRKEKTNSIDFNNKKSTEKPKNSNSSIQLQLDPCPELGDKISKKLKTEKTENPLVRKDINQLSRKKFQEEAKEALNLLKAAASNPDHFNDNPRALAPLNSILEYKTKNQKIVFTKDIFERKLKNAITPAIFTKKNLQIKVNRQKDPINAAFENYLALVSKLYYRATHQINDLTNLLESKDMVQLEEEILQMSNGNKKNSKNAKRGRTKTNNNGSTLELAIRSGGEKNVSTTSMGIKNTGIDIDNKGGFEQETNKFPESFATVFTDVLDILISPIKVDQVFEKWSPKEIAIFESGLCKYGKEFSFIQFLIGTKSLNEVIQFYFSWKSTSHYRIWKHYKNLDNKGNYNSWL